jgi:hypothetical protein
MQTPTTLLPMSILAAVDPSDYETTFPHAEDKIQVQSADRRKPRIAADQPSFASKINPNRRKRMTKLY